MIKETISKNITQMSLMVMVFTFPCRSFSQQLSFPGAEGFGKFATGGRGGKVVIVKNLNDDGPGSLRQALIEHPQDPITIIFGMSGIIELKSPLQVRRSNLTIAGQTAPGDGICLKGHSFIINGANKNGNHGNIIIRFIRSRPGGKIRSGMYGFDMENCHDVIIDHCSFSWANEEVAAMYDTKNTTVQWCIISEGLYDAGHQKGYRSYGGVWGGQNASYHHNLLAHLNNRTVRFNGARAHDTIALIDYRNNVIYNWGEVNAPYGGDVKIQGGVSRINMVNNYYIPGPATPTALKFMHALYAQNENTGVGQWHLSGNIMEGNSELTNNNWKGLDLSALPSNARNEAMVTKAFNMEVGLSTESAREAYISVLSNAGATLPKRDAVDERIVSETKKRTASGTGKSGKPGIIDSPVSTGGWDNYKTVAAPADSDSDGMPDDWEKKNKLNPSDSEDRNIVGKDGYTMLEQYLNFLIKNKFL